MKGTAAMGGPPPGNPWFWARPFRILQTSMPAISQPGIMIMAVSAPALVHLAQGPWSLWTAGFFQHNHSCTAFPFFGFELGLINLSHHL